MFVFGDDEELEQQLSRRQRRKDKAPRRYPAPPEYERHQHKLRRKQVEPYE